MSGHDYMAAVRVLHNSSKQLKVLHTPRRIKMRVGFVQQKHRLMFLGKFEKPENRYQLLFSFARFTERERPVDVADGTRIRTSASSFEM